MVVDLAEQKEPQLVVSKDFELVETSVDWMVEPWDSLLAEKKGVNLVVPTVSRSVASRVGKKVAVTVGQSAATKGEKSVAKTVDRWVV
jgi:hypothetical protein